MFSVTMVTLNMRAWRWAAIAGFTAARLAGRALFDDARRLRIRGPAETAAYVRDEKLISQL
jgi:hypothetical protein